MIHFATTLIFSCDIVTLREYFENILLQRQALEEKHNSRLKIKCFLNSNKYNLINIDNVWN